MNSNEEYFIKNYKRFFNYAVKLTKSRTEAEDLLHNAYIKIKTTQHKVVNGTYMFNTMKNLNLNSRRSKKISQIINDSDLPYSYNTVNTDYSTQDNIEYETKLNLIKQTIPLLTKKQKIIIKDILDGKENELSSSEPKYNTWKTHRAAAIKTIKGIYEDYIKDV